MFPSLLHQLFSEQLCQRLGSMFDKLLSCRKWNVSCYRGLLRHILSFIMLQTCQRGTVWTAGGRTLLLQRLLFLTCCTILPLHIFPSHALGLSETLFIPSHISNLLPVNLITCHMIHQLFPFSISQLLQSFVLWNLLLHQTPNEDLLFKKQWNVSVSTFEMFSRRSEV